MRRPMSVALTLLAFVSLVCAILGIVLVLSLLEGPWMIQSNDGIWKTPDIHAVAKASLAASIIILVMLSLGLWTVWRDFKKTLRVIICLVGLDAIVMVGVGSAYAAMADEIKDIHLRDSGKCFDSNEFGDPSTQVDCQPTRDLAHGATACYFVGSVVALVWALLGGFKASQCCAPCAREFCHDDERADRNKRVGGTDAAKLPAVQHAKQRFLRSLHQRPDASTLPLDGGVHAQRQAYQTRIIPVVNAISTAEGPCLDGVPTVPRSASPPPSATVPPPYNGLGGDFGSPPPPPLYGASALPLPVYYDISGGGDREGVRLSAAPQPLEHPPYVPSV